MAVLFLLTVACWPTDALVVRLLPANGREVDPVPIFAAVAPLGQSFRTSYIHSVQRTPVVDVYRIVDGRIWSWREYVQSHNAGLPFQPPPLGRFRMLPPWMMIEGGRQAWPDIVLRVGNEELGRNVFAYGETGPGITLYRLHPGKRLLFRVERLPLLCLDGANMR